MGKSFKVILDTNFLLTMVRYKIHAINEIKNQIPVDFFVLSGIIDEMQGLSKEKKIKKEVAIITKILEANKVQGIKSQLPNVDDELVSLSKEYVIATNDKELRKRIREFGGKTIYIKKLTTVDLENVID